MKTFLKAVADMIVRNLHSRANRSRPQLAGRNFDAVAHAAALEVLG